MALHTLHHGSLAWVYLENPTAADVVTLAERYQFHPLDLEDCLGITPLPKIDDRPDYLFLTLHFPRFDRALRVSVPAEVNIFLGRDYLVTVQQGDLRPLSTFFQQCQEDEEARIAAMGQSAGYLLYQVLSRFFLYLNPMLNRVVANIEGAEEELYRNPGAATVRELAVLRRDIIALRRILRPQTPLIASLERHRHPVLARTGDLPVYFGDLADQYSAVWNTLETYREVMDSIIATSEALTSFRLNSVIRILTIITTIMLPPTLLASIYGMNIALPFQDSPYAIGGVLLAMMVIVGGMLLVFRRMRWF